jgi:hypothetical protein
MIVRGLLEEGLYGLGLGIFLSGSRALGTSASLQSESRKSKYSPYQILLYLQSIKQPAQ